MEQALAGIRVLDLSEGVSGPYCTHLLAGYGAEVIKVEKPGEGDITRHIGPFLDDTPGSERSGLFLYLNSNKKGITLNLKTRTGVEMFKELVRISDVVMENYTVRVMKNFGLDYPVLREINPKLIMLSMPAHGCTGPWREYPGFAYPMEQMAGIPQLTGDPDGPPRMTETSPSDPAAGINGTMAVLMALMYRQRTGRGQHIDLSQVEALTCLMGDAIVEYTMNHNIRPRLGNHHPFWAPHGYYRCKGDDKWVGIVVTSDEEWQAFCNSIGNPHWAKDERFAGSLGRWQNQDELDKRIEEWTQEHDHYEVMQILQKAGIAAGPVLAGDELLNDPHLKERGFYQRLEREVVGTHAYPIPTGSMRLSKCPISLRRPAPLVGEHNEYVFARLLGMSPEEIQALIDKQVIGDIPIGGLITKI